ncbi:MAG: Arc family DNA-binding protein [Caulobacter sp.]|nr:Arc family DNA-binding protein [Caulobacter sp.]MBX3481589.1 Arc family DNA-binding protein [Caulobacter sp.]
MASPGKRAFLIRVKPEVLDAVERLAADELRSVNAQVEVLLREALTKRGRLKKGEGGGK